MAFLDSSNPKVIGPRKRLEERPFTVNAPSIVWTATQYRWVKELLLVYAIDDAGGESPPATYVYGGETYQIVAAEPDLSYDQLLGTFTAVYLYTTAWSFTIP